MSDYNTNKLRCVLPFYKDDVGTSIFILTPLGNELSLPSSWLLFPHTTRRNYILQVQVWVPVWVINSLFKHHLISSSHQHNPSCMLSRINFSYIQRIRMRNGCRHSYYPHVMFLHIERWGHVGEGHCSSSPHGYPSELRRRNSVQEEGEQIRVEVLLGYLHIIHDTMMLLKHPVQ